MFSEIYHNFSNSKSSIRTQNFLKKQEFENSVVTKVAWSMKHHFGGILRRIYKPSRKFSIKGPYPYLSKCTDPLKVNPRGVKSIKIKWIDISYIIWLTKRQPTLFARKSMGRKLGRVELYRLSYTALELITKNCGLTCFKS